MLKWAVHVPRKSYLPPVDASRNFPCRGQQCDEREIIPIFHGSPRTTACSKTRMFSDKYMFYGRENSENKKNHFIPVPLTVSVLNRPERTFPSPSHCKHLSNITPDSNWAALEKHIIWNNIDPLRFLSRRAISAHCNVPSSKVEFDFSAYNTWIIGKDFGFLNTSYKSHRTNKITPVLYASTLPSLEIDYSACDVIPGQILALHGIGDMYFEKPLYFSQQLKRCSSNEGEKIRHLNILSNIVSHKSLYSEGSSSLGSTKMSDLTLDCMTDTLLVSSRKDRKAAIRRPRSEKHGDCLPTTSPTYTPAEDPASDLYKYRENGISDFDQIQSSYYREPILTFSEREVRSPHVNYRNRSNLQRGHETFPLRRLRAIRRKRKSALLHSNIKNFYAPKVDRNHNNFNNKCICVGDFNETKRV